MSIREAISRTLYGLKALDARILGQIILYPYRKAYSSAKFSKVRGAQRAKGSALRGIRGLIGRKEAQVTGHPEEYAFPGSVLAHQWQPTAPAPERQRLELICENALVRIDVLAPDLMRVRVSPSGRFPSPFSYAVAKEDKEWTPVDIEVEETEGALLIRTSRLCCRADKGDLALTFLDPDGTVVSADAPGAGWDPRGERVACWKRLPPDEHIYGLGQKTTALDKRGLAFQMWNAGPPNYGPGDDPLYANIPFYLGLRDGRAYGLFFDNSARGRFDFGAGTPDVTRFDAECGEMRYYVFYGPELATVLDRYTELTGRMAMPPLWALGYHQNRWSYSPEARTRDIAHQFRQRRIPCEAIHLDIDYMDGFRCFTWHPERFPDPGKLIADLHADGFKVVVMLDPGIKVDPDYWVHAEGIKRGVFCKYPDGTLYGGPVWPGECHFPDYTSPRVRAWWGALYREMIDLGVDGFWNDMNEPMILSYAGDTFPDVVQHDWEGQGADHRLAHNTYGMQMARATAEGVTRLRPAERPMVITRSLWAGAQRYAMHWLGDNRSDWSSLRNVMQLVMNLGMSGIAFTGPDTGGFAGTPDGELLIRWNQLSTFTPFFRNHTAKATEDQEPWVFGEPCEQISRKFIELRYRLLPYLYTAFWQSAQSGIPIMRPLSLAFQDDPHSAEIDDEFMCGDAFLVAPVVQPQSTSRRLYIPKGWWFDFWDGTLTAGPQITRVQAPLDRIPLFVRAGSIVPTWPVMQHTGERPVDALTLHVYPGSGESVLYEDDGHTWAFQRGEYRITRLRCEMHRSRLPLGADRETHRPGALSIERKCEGPFDPGYANIEVILHGLPSPPRTTIVDGRPLTETRFDPQARTMSFETQDFRTIQVSDP